jgi:phosphoribosylamine--glycine ligase/phosphoribosylaminoimidazole synthetase
MAKVLVVGSGGREHALADAFAISPQVGRVFVAPGNGGTGVWHVNVPIEASDLDGLVHFAVEEGIDLTFVGPEVPLAAGVVDRFEAAGLRCFGPSAATARLEASKAFAKEMMLRTGVPTARSRTFTDYDEAIAYVRGLDHEVVIKASGLAAGKGAIVTADRAEAEAALRRLLVERELGDAGEVVLVEERLLGEEVSLLAFCDGKTLAVMPAAQDHKRVGDGDVGPNTGGMGAYAPAPVVEGRLQELADLSLRPILEAFAAEGTPFRGILYAGLMMTADGPKVLEYNCRFGDPEAQVLLPLLKTDLYELVGACVAGRLDEIEVVWHGGSAATVVAASRGYPDRYRTGLPIRGVAEASALEGVDVYQAGTARREGELLTAGGRVLAVTGVGADLREALSRAYAGVDLIRFDGMHVRRDIGHRALNKAASPRVTYRDAGVDIEAGHRAVQLMKAAVERTHGPRVLGGLGSFGGLFSAGFLRDMVDPILVASTDGVGTKTKVASMLGRYDTVGHDIVNHCIDDILVQGAEPLFFLDYVASSKLDPEVVATIVKGAAEACGAAGCALLGGETAEMPGVYTPGEFDLVGTIVGVVDRPQLIDGSAIRIGDAVLALPSAGLHTNGFSLARRVLAGMELEVPLPALGGRTLGDALLAPHRSYLAEIRKLRGAGVPIHGLAHITGGGLRDNPPRVLPTGTAFELDPASWTLPPLFRLIQETGGIDDDEMRHVFNCGIGLLIVMPAGEAERALALLPGVAWRVGDIVARCEGAPVVYR